MQEEISHMQQVFLFGEINLQKTPIPSCINQMNRDVLQFLFSTEHILQVHNLSLFSLKASNPKLLKFCLCLGSYFLAFFLEELAPIIYKITLI